MGHWGVWGYVLAGVRVIEEGGVIGMGYFVWRMSKIKRYYFLPKTYLPH